LKQPLADLIPFLSGGTRWMRENEHSSQFSLPIPDTSAFKDGEYWVIVWARVDSNWGVKNQVYFYFFYCYVL